MARMLVNRVKALTDPTLSFVPLPRVPPKGCWATTDPELLVLM
jgi:hypothetical protein